MTWAHDTSSASVVFMAQIISPERKVLAVFPVKPRVDDQHTPLIQITPTSLDSRQGASILYFHQLDDPDPVIGRGAREI